MEPRVFGNLLQTRGSTAFGCRSLGFPWGRPANLQTLVGSRRQHEPLQVRLGSHWHPHAAGSLSIPHSSLAAPASQAPGTWHRSHQTGPGERNSEMFSLFVLWLELVDTLVTILMAGGFLFVWLVDFCLFSCFSSTATRFRYRWKWQPTPVFLPGESQGQRSLVGCRLWGHTELDTEET